MADLRRFKTNKIFEVFLFNKESKKYPKLNRLMMMFITCEEFKDELYKTAFLSNRYFVLEGIKTTCFSRYRKVKLNNGILNIVERKREKNGLYKILYETNFHKMGYKDCIKNFLYEEEKNIKDGEDC